MTDINRNTFCYFDRNCHAIWRCGIWILALTILFSNTAFAIDEEFKEYCLGDAFDEKYSDAGCWSCDVVKVLMSAMMKVTNSLFTVIQDLCKRILEVGAALWLALYFLKSLSSFAAQDPAKVLDGALMFMFKWAVMYTLIFGGMDMIMSYVVNPLLSIGFDIGKEFAGNSRISLL